MFVRKDVFDDEHTPQRLLHREREVGVLSDAFEPAIGGAPAANVLLHGPSGVGKTALATHTIDRLHDYADVATVQIDCLGTDTAQLLGRTYQAVGDSRPTADDFGSAADSVTAAASDSETPTSVAGGEGAPAAAAVADLEARLREAVSRPTIVVLDEADSLPATQAVARLVGIPQVSVVVIAHEADSWLARAADPVREAIATTIKLDRYGVADLAAILRARAKRGLVSGAVTDRQLESIADRVAGVARFGIQTLRCAAEEADDRGRSTIEEDDISKAVPRARERIRRMNLRSLPLHHHVLYALIHDGGEISGRELHNRYDAVAEAVYEEYDLTPVGRKSRRNKLQKLREYDLIVREGATSRPRYHVADASIQPSLSLPDRVEI